MKSFADTFPPATAVTLSEMVEYGTDAVVSRTLAKSDGGTLTLFAFSKGQELSEHTAPFDAFVQVADGVGEFIIDGLPVRVEAGQSILMPADRPHAVKAVESMKMILFMLRK